MIFKVFTAFKVKAFKRANSKYPVRHKYFDGTGNYEYTLTNGKTYRFNRAERKTFGRTRREA